LCATVFLIATLAACSALRPPWDSPPPAAANASPPAAAPSNEQPGDAAAGAKAAAPRADTPVTHTPKPDAPKPDAPVDAPKPDAPKPDAPKADAPKPDVPAHSQETTTPPRGTTAETSTEEPPEPSATPEDSEPMIDRTRRAVRSTTEWLARGVDSWFGDKPFEQGGKVTNGRLSVSVLKRETETLDTNVRLNVRLRLPNVEERTYLFFGRDNEQEAVSDTPGALSRQDRLLTDAPEDRSFFAGLGLALLDVFELRAGFRGIKPYAQARYRKPWTLSERDLVEFRHTFFWKVHDRLGATTALSYDHAYSETVAVRWLSAVTITQQTEQFEWSSLLGTYKAFNGGRVLGLELIGSGSQRSPKTFSEYGVQTKWAQPIYKDWLILELMVGHFWPYREDTHERSPIWGAGAGLTMKF
jgi:hypothetical protein